MLQRYLRDCVSLVSHDSDSECNYNVYNGGTPFEDSAESCNVVAYSKSGKPAVILKTQATMDSLQLYYLYGTCSESSNDELRFDQFANNKNQKQKKQVKRQDSRSKMQVKRQHSRSKLISTAKDGENFGNQQEKKYSQKQSCMKQQEKVVSQNRSKGAEVQDKSVSKNNEKSKVDEKEVLAGNKSGGRKAISRSMSYNVGRTSGYELLKRRYFKCDTKKTLVDTKDTQKQNVISTIVEPSKGEEHAHVLQHSQTMPTDLASKESAKVSLPQIQSQELLDTSKATSPFSKQNVEVKLQKEQDQSNNSNIEFCKSTPNILSRDESTVLDPNKSQDNLQQTFQEQKVQKQVVQNVNESTVLSSKLQDPLKGMAKNQTTVQDSVSSASPRTPIGKINRESSFEDSKRTSDFDSVATPIPNSSYEDLKNLSKIEERANLQEGQNLTQNNTIESKQENESNMSPQEPTKIVTKFHTSPENQKKQNEEVTQEKPVGKVSKASQMFENKGKFLENQKSTPSRMSPQSPLPQSRGFIARAATFTNRAVQPQAQPPQPKQDTPSSKKRLAGLIARFEAAN